jgi:hypothetical protein
MISRASTNLFIAWVFNIAISITTGYRNNAFNSGKNILNTPKTASASSYFFDAHFLFLFTIASEQHNYVMKT